MPSKEMVDVAPWSVLHDDPSATLDDILDTEIKDQTTLCRADITSSKSARYRLVHSGSLELKA